MVALGCNSIQYFLARILVKLEGNGPMEEQATRAMRNKFVMLCVWFFP